MQYVDFAEDASKLKENKKGYEWFTTWYAYFQDVW
jgi:hypothetical protein